MNNLGRQWKQDPLIMTPKELEGHVQNVIESNPHRTTTERVLKYPHGACYDAACLVHGYMPHGSHIAVYGGKHYNEKSENPQDWYSNHVVHHVPTTEGMHAVDITHKQFEPSAKTPLVEPLEKFQERKSMKGFRTLRTDAEHAALYKEGKKTQPLGKKMAKSLKRDVT